jgi:hypothetical protein
VLQTSQLCFNTVNSMILVLTLEKSNLLVDSLGQRMSTEVTLVAFHVVEDYDVLQYTLGRITGRIPFTQLQ